ncbi:MAG: cardiolipin synthase [Clostridium sp.]|nr:cardiolipin synthase [Clostridium sp.]
MVVLVAAFRWMREYLAYFFGATTVLSATVLIYIISGEDNSSIKLSWVVPILVIPVFGTLFYLFIRLQPGTFLINRRIQELGERVEPYLEQDPKVLEDYNNSSKSGGNLVRYMNRFGKYPVYENTAVSYFPLGDDYYPELLRQLRQAKRFIFMEYFIVERGHMWNSILEVLEEKAEEGVDVRFMYDGMCSLTLLPHDYPKELQKKGIRCKMFSPVKPALSSYQNNRDHRKICVIDGHTAFTGGVNLADEYINEKVRFGHWKDTGVMLKGEAVTSFTMMFLQMWGITEHEPEDYSPYIYRAGNDLTLSDGMKESGFVMPYADSPMDGENVGEQVYLDILGNARQYVHIMTPYLILDDITLAALKYAAKRGVETIIIMPHIPDKIYAYLLARSYYEELLKAGVRIYEYTPGFCHAKSFVSDDEEAVVGTINLDYRSLYLHFECAAYFYRNPVVQDVEQDFQATLTKCQEITLENCRKYPFIKRFAGRALRLFAPMM